VPGNLPSERPAISGDGAVIAFQSAATNLTAVCATGGTHIYVHVRITRITTCISVTPAGLPGNAGSEAPAISANGQVVAFRSDALDLVAFGCTTGVPQVFARELATGVTECVSVGTDGTPGNVASGRPALSAAGTVVAFESGASFPGSGCDTGGTHIFVRDRSTGLTICASVTNAGAPGGAASAGPRLSDDGTLVAFQSGAALAAPCTNGIPQIFVRNLPASLTTCVTVGLDGSPGDAASFDVALSGDGRIVAYSSTAGNLTGGGVAALGRAAGPRVAAFAQIIRRSIAVTSAVAEVLSQSGGGQGNGTSQRPALSRTGAITAFQSSASNLVSDDTNNRDDVYVVEGITTTDRPVITAPGNGTQYPLAAPTPVTFTWTAVPNATRYGFEFTGANLAFRNPNGSAPDGVNGFGGAGGGFPVGGTSFPVILTPDFPAGTYQVRVIGLTDTFLTVGVFSDAITVVLGASPIPPDARPVITAPAANTNLLLGGPVQISWNVVPGVGQYLVEVTGPGRAFSNPNGPIPDPGALGSLVVPGTVVQGTVPPLLAPGAYQVRVICLNGSGQPVGTFSDAVTVVVQ
jgi:hypothetical protein